MIFFQTFLNFPRFMRVLAGKKIANLYIQNGAKAPFVGGYFVTVSAILRVAMFSTYALSAILSRRDGFSNNSFNVDDNHFTENLS